MLALPEALPTVGAHTQGPSCQGRSPIEPMAARSPRLAGEPMSVLLVTSVSRRPSSCHRCRLGPWAQCTARLQARAMIASFDTNPARHQATWSILGERE
eukprot:439156-Prymnesium_polylepis.2